jgi:hypothetical protein
MAEDPLVAVNRPGHHDQTLPQVADRGYIAVVEVLLHLIDSPLDRAAVHRVVAEVDHEI